MKIYIKTALSLFLLVGLVSCSDWFDVSPKTDVKAEDLFKTESGFQSALTGVYVLMTQQRTYGKAYTYGLMDQLAQRYDKHPTNNPSDAERAVIYEYTKTNDTYNTKPALARLWNDSYKIIANANNLINWLDKNGDRVIREKQARDFMRGEVLGLRALIHFDLLRSWGPMYRSDSTSASIPYRVITDNRKLRRLPANEVVSKIVADLKAAEQLLLEEEGNGLGSYMNSNRRYRMNLHAVRALMARVCNYRNDKLMAVNYANKVLAHSNLRLVTNLSEDAVMFGETLFALSCYQQTENQKSDFSEGPNFVSQLYVKDNTLDALYEKTMPYGNADIRYGDKLGFLKYPANQQSIVRKYLKSQNTIPLIRLAEVYYILCEASPIAESAQWLNFVRNNRGISNLYNYGSFASDIERQTALDLEYRKEFYAEGQYFFFLKLHEMSTFLKCPLLRMGKAEYVFPLPDDEVEFGWTDEDSDTE